jgi:Uma2 family endonuclease
MYCAVTPGVDLYDNATVRLDVDNEVQPDALLRLDTGLGGTSQISPDDYIEGAPELIVEVAATSASYDLHDKFTVYRRNGVQEYVVWRVYDNEVDWYSLAEGVYVLLTPGEDGILRSQVFPGLQLVVEALLNGDLASVLDELQKGLATPEYKAYIELLSSRKNMAKG